MLYIVFKDQNIREVRIHLTKFGLLPKFSEEIDFIQADCDELVAILSQFQNLPSPLHQRVVKWYGETARFIYNNLK